MIISYAGFLDLIWFLTNSKIKLLILGRPQIFAASIIDQGHLSVKLEAKSTTQLDTQLYLTKIRSGCQLTYFIVCIIVCRSIGMSVTQVCHLVQPLDFLFWSPRCIGQPAVIVLLTLQ